MTVRKRRRSGRSLSRIPVFPVTFPFHAGGQALLVTAVLATVALAFVHHAVLVVAAGVGQVLAYGAFEETFATFAAVHPIMLPCEETKGGGGQWWDPQLGPTHPQGGWVEGGEISAPGWRAGGRMEVASSSGVHLKKDPGVPIPCGPPPQRTLVSLYLTLRKIKVSLSAVPP